MRGNIYQGKRTRWGSPRFERHELAAGVMRGWVGQPQFARQRLTFCVRSICTRN